MSKLCIGCGRPIPWEPLWKTMCVDCFKRSRKETKPETTLVWGKPAVPAPQLSPEMISKMLILCHPDRHGDSELSKEVTMFLIKLRKGGL